MGSQHVPLFIGDDGLVKSVGLQNNEDQYETCVMCGGKAHELKTTHIDFRTGYVEGSGQVCVKCYSNHMDLGMNYLEFEERMAARRQLFTVSAEDVLMTPNDAELGAKVRQAYWSIYGDAEVPVENQWICSVCGKDTSEVDIDYLVNTDHLECVLKMNP